MEEFTFREPINDSVDILELKMVYKRVQRCRCDGRRMHTMADGGRRDPRPVEKRTPALLRFVCTNGLECHTHASNRLQSKRRVTRCRVRDRSLLHLQHRYHSRLPAFLYFPGITPRCPVRPSHLPRITSKSCLTRMLIYTFETINTVDINSVM